MADYTDMISRQSSDDPLVPTPVSDQIIEEMPKSSFLLQRAGRVVMSTKSQRQPVLSVLPTAYWVNGDSGMKQTSAVDWTNVSLVAEEIAVIVPIPESYLDDAQVPIWDEVRPRIVEALGAKIDAAGLFGINKPASWPLDIYSSLIAAGNYITAGSSLLPGGGQADFGVDVTRLAEMISEDGFAINGFASRPGLGWRLTGLRSPQGVAIYQANMTEPGGAGNLYGYPLNEVVNGSWERPYAELIAGDWTKCLLGMRQDITWKMFSEGVISDDSGLVKLNLMQQDSIALRVTMRIAFATSNPVTTLQPNANLRYAFGAIIPTVASGS